MLGFPPVPGGYAFPPGPASWIKEPPLPDPLLPALSCVGHDGQATAAAAGESRGQDR